MTHFENGESFEYFHFWIKPLGKEPDSGGVGGWRVNSGGVVVTASPSCHLFSTFFKRLHSDSSNFIKAPDPSLSDNLFGRWDKFPNMEQNFQISQMLFAFRMDATLVSRLYSSRFTLGSWVVFWIYCISRFTLGILNILYIQVYPWYTEYIVYLGCISRFTLGWSGL